MSEKEAYESGPQRHSPSLFGPVILIAIGLYFLAANLGIAPDLHWGAAFRLWPLLLVFGGLNVVVHQLPRPIGSILSVFVAVLTILVFGTVLLFADEIPALERFAGSSNTYTTESIEFPADNIEAATVQIDLSEQAATIGALNDSPNLIEGQISHRGTLVFETNVDAGTTHINLDTINNDGFVHWLNPGNWDNGAGADWQINLNPNVLTDLALDFSSGAVVADLSQLSLSRLQIDGSSGRVEVMLPVGDYDLDYDMSSGALLMTLPASGRYNFDIDGGSGSINLRVPDSMEMQVVVDEGSGRFNPTDRFTQITQNDDTIIWQTEGYNSDAPNRIHLNLDISSGSVQVQAAE